MKTALLYLSNGLVFGYIDVMDDNILDSAKRYLSWRDDYKIVGVYGSADSLAKVYRKN